MGTLRKQPLTLDEIRKSRKPIPKVKKEITNDLPLSHKLALFITKRVGSMGFFMVIFTWTVLWLGWNMLAPKNIRFDPFPGFVLWLFISNMIQLFLMPLIMIGQNLESAVADKRSEADYEINKQAELEIETILTHLEYQNDLILEILEKLEARNEGSSK